MRASLENQVILTIMPPIGNTALNYLARNPDIREVLAKMRDLHYSTNVVR
jgi:hypothetical protein